MFKARLIENNKYYSLRSKQIILILFPSILIGIIANFYQFPFWITITAIGIYVLTFKKVIANQKLMNSMIQDKSIEIDETEIRIKSNKNNQIETINIEDVKKVLVKKEYRIPQESIKEITKEIKGKPKKNYLIIHQKNEQRKFDFEIDSYFMINQLDKIIEKWIRKGYKIEKV